MKVPLASVDPAVLAEEEKKWRGIEPRVVMPLILQAACDLFCVNGYHGTSIRSIAKKSGLSVPGLYHHYESKHEILDKLVTLAIDELLDAVHEANKASGNKTINRFNHVIGTLIKFHIVCRKKAFVASTEMRSMNYEALHKHIQKRDEIQRVITDIILQGSKEEIFKCDNINETSRAIASLCVSISTWYRPQGKSGVNEITEIHLEIIRRMAGHIYS